MGTSIQPRLVGAFGMGAVLVVFLMLLRGSVDTGSHHPNVESLLLQLSREGKYERDVLLHKLQLLEGVCDTGSQNAVQHFRTSARVPHTDSEAAPKKANVVNGFPLDAPLSSMVFANEPKLPDVVDQLLKDHPDMSDRCKTWMKRAKDPYNQDSTGNHAAYDYHPWPSQFAEDFWLFVNYFYKREGGPTGGVYIDLGANHPLVNSDTHVFDVCLKWTGICFEANPGHAARFADERSCEMINMAIGAENGTVQFDGGQAGTGQVSDDQSQDTIHAVFGASQEMISVPQTSMTEVLKHRPWITHIDLLKVDVEGAELAALRGFPWDKVTVDYVIVENPWYRLDTREFMTTHGFRMLFILGPDEMWVRGQPSIPLKNHFTMLRESGKWSGDSLTKALLKDNTVHQYDMKPLETEGWTAYTNGQPVFPHIKYPFEQQGVPARKP